MYLANVEKDVTWIWKRCMNSWTKILRDYLIEMLTLVPFIFSVSWKWGGEIQGHWPCKLVGTSDSWGSEITGQSSHVAVP